ncbi:ketose-bisphosphate aldolase [Streptacidiphilus sp. EB129]|uniref:class II fructose-bisphosphate aldolase n=1 Tax=Streptacidiphilus sp. EB129 TaxID=3156262 RepID=UPI0035177BBE
MPLTGTGAVVAPASAAGRGVGAFNVIQLEHAEGIVAGAEDAGAPVILQISENAVRYHGSVAPIGAAVLALARAASVPVAVHLDHATSADLVHECVGLGFSSVMFDASTLDYADNVKATAAVVRHCHAAGVWVEAELGEVGGKDGVHAPGARTEPAEAVRFVDSTGVDALAVAVGSSHAMLTRDAVLDFALITALRGTVPVPLVLHGSSGVSDADLARAVDAGMTKINIATHLNTAFTAAVRAQLTVDQQLVDTRKYLGPARTAVATEVSRLLRLLAR